VETRRFYSASLHLPRYKYNKPREHHEPGEKSKRKEKHRELKHFKTTQYFLESVMTFPSPFMRFHSPPTGTGSGGRTRLRNKSGRHPPPSQTNLLLSEGAPFSETSLSTSGLAENGGAGSADDDGLGVREDGGNVKAARALHVHEERARSWDQSLAVRSDIAICMPA